MLSPFRTILFTAANKASTTKHANKTKTDLSHSSKSSLKWALIFTCQDICTFMKEPNPCAMRLSLSTLIIAFMIRSALFLLFKAMQATMIGLK